MPIIPSLAAGKTWSERIVRKSRHLAALALAALCLTSPSSLHAQPAPLPTELREQLETIFEDAEVPGAAIAVIEEGELRFLGNFGTSDLARERPVDDETIFRAGSISKSFTAIAIMQLVDQGRLNLDDPVSAYLPDLLIDNPWNTTDPVRIVHLLEHTAGLNDIAFRHYLIESADSTIADAVMLYSPYRARWRPGTRTSYSNAGPVIAGRIVEIVSGQPFEEYIAENIFGPLGMNTARWTRTPDIADHLSASFAFDGNTPEPFIEIVGRPSGSLNTSARNLALLPMLMLRRGSWEGQQLLSPASIRRIESPASSDAARAGLRHGYALGNDVNLDGRSTFYGHDGSIDGFVATARYSPELNAGYVIMINVTSTAIDDAALAIRAYLERNTDAPTIQAEPIPNDLRQLLSGQFQTSTPRRSFLAALIGLSQWEGARLEGSQLIFKRKTWTHVGGGQFHADGESAPGIIALQDDSEFVLQSGSATYRRVGPIEMWSKLIIVAVICAIAFAAAIYSVIWLVGAMRGKLAERGGVAPRLWPSLALSASIGAAIAPLMLFGTGSFALLGQPTILGWLVFSITLAAPFIVIMAAIVFWRRKGNLVSTAMGAAQLAAATTICLYLMEGGWFALRIWNA